MNESRPDRAVDGTREARQGTPQRRRVLLAEDDHDFRELLAVALRDAGYAVTTCATGMELVDRLSAYLLDDGGERFDVVVSDVRMPGVTGMEVLGGLGEPGRRPPVILFTAFGDRETHELARRLGAVAMLDKPFTVDALLREIEKHATAGTPSRDIDGSGDA